MDSTTFWEENGSVRIPVKFESSSSSDGGTAALQTCKEEQSLFQFCDGNLNFATVATSEDDEFSFNKKKLSRDPMSHRIIEKRRRDRMNNCLADLSRLIPADYLKKGRGRIEKTEIIEMAIKHMNHLQTRATRPTDGEDSDQAPSQQEVRSAPIDSEHYRLGYQECLSEAMHFMVEVEGFYAGDPICVQLMNHLQKHCDKILKGDRLNCPRAHVNETTSNSSGSSGSSYPPHPSPPSSASPCEGNATSSLYKFKNNIKQRFSAEHDRSTTKRRRFEADASRRHSDTCSPPPSPSPPPPPASPAVPIFALHARGSHYVPLTLDADVLAPLLDDLGADEDAATLVLHPVTISVDFRSGVGKLGDSRGAPTLWRTEPSGFIQLPGWFRAGRHPLAIPPYSKHV